MIRGLGKETVPVSGSKQSSVVSERRKELKEVVSRVLRVSSDFYYPDSGSYTSPGEWAGGHQLFFLLFLQCILQFVSVLFNCCSKPDGYGCICTGQIE